LSGRDLALARLRNRIRFGAEGATIGAGFSLMGKAFCKNSIGWFKNMV
jgi:hypothetical protein